MAKGDGFAVCTMKKQTGAAGGLSAHIDREVWDEENQCMVPFRPASVRDDARTALNRECIESAQKIGRTQAIWNRLRDAGFSRKNDDKRDDGKKTRKIKQDAVIAICFVCTSDEETMKKLEAEGKLDEWIDATLEWFYKEFGKENVVSAVLHMDETTPHLHVTVVPITTEEAKVRKEKPKFDENGTPIRKYETDKDGNIILDAKGRATPVKRSYKKKEVTARLSAKDIANPISMDRWQEEYPKAVAKFGLKRGEKGSPLKNKAPAEYNLEQIQEQTAETKQQLDTISAELTEVTSAVEKQTATINSNNIKIEEQASTIEQQASTIEQQSSTIEQQETAISSNQNKITQQEADIKKMTHGSMFDKMFRSGLTPEVKKAFEEKDAEHKEEMRQATMATHPNGKPIFWADGNKKGMQLTWEEYAKYLKEQEKKKEEQAKADKQAAVDQAKAEAKTKYDAALQKEKLAFNKDGDPIRWTGGSKKGQQVTKDERIDFLEKQVFKWEDAYNALVNRLKPARDLMFALLSLNFRKVVEIILEQWKAGLKEFAKNLKDFLLEAMKEEKTVKDRKLYVEDAFKGAKLLALTDAKWTAKEEYLKPLYDDAMRIADGTWESYHSNQKEKEAAVEAVASLANTPNRRYWQESDIRAVSIYLATVPAGELNAAINELKELAADEYNIRNKDWLNDVIKRLKDNSIVNGQGLGTGGR